MPDRCFVAAELPESALESIRRATGILRELAPGWRGEKWVASGLHHVTLAFLGAVPDAALDETLDRLRAAAALHAQLHLRLSGARAVPGTRHANMVWAAVEDSAAGGGTMRDSLLSAGGAAPDLRAFTPHVTLVRARRPRRIAPEAIARASEVLSEAGKGPDGLMSVPTLTVFSSTLGSHGPEYLALAHLDVCGG